VVNERQRRLGAGRALMQVAEAWAKEKGAKFVRVRSNAIRGDAHAFYRGLHYTVSATSLLFIKPLG
jgi:GNAT superfamily N-acetyltransferase